MSEPKNHSTPSFALIFSISLLSWIILIPLVNQIWLPLGDNKTGVISLASLQNLSPYTDYLKYLMLLGVPLLLVTMAVKIKAAFFLPFLTLLSRLLQNTKLIAVLTLILVSSWIIYKNLVVVTERGVPDWGNPITDSFHEGEYLGFLPNFLQWDKPFLKTLFVHGFGLNALPTLIAHQLSDSHHTIALTRFFVILENTVASLGYFWVLWEMSQRLGVKIGRFKFFLLSCFLFCGTEGLFFSMDGRRSALFLIQLSLTLRFFRRVKSPVHSLEVKILPIIIGASLPISLLYVYDRAAYFGFVYCCASLMTLCFGKKLALTWLKYSAIGVTFALGLMMGILGLDQIAAIISQVLYWVKYGKYISFLPLPPLEINVLSQPFGIAIMFQMSTFIYLILEYRKGGQKKLRELIQKHDLVILLLSAALIYMRMVLDRSDISHISKGASITALLGFYWVGFIYQTGENHLIHFSLKPFRQLFLATLFSLFILATPGFNLSVVLKNLAHIPQHLSVPDEKLIPPDYQEAAKTLQPEIEKQSCFFTLTSEGLWYYLFQKPSCSKFSYVYYAKPTVSQQEVIQELEKNQPPIILFTNEMWSNTLDGIPTSDAAAILYQYILTHYQPYKLIHSHWFWRHSKTPLSFTQNPSIQSFLDHFPHAPLYQGENASFSGWGVLPQTGKPIDAVYLSYGFHHQLIAVAKVDTPRPDVVQVLSNPAYQKSGWTLTIPTTALPLGDNILKLWGYDAQTQQLVQMGQDITVKIIEAKTAHPFFSPIH